MSSKRKTAEESLRIQKKSLTEQIFGNKIALIILGITILTFVSPFVFNFNNGTNNYYADVPLELTSNSMFNTPPEHDSVVTKYDNNEIDLDINTLLKIGNVEYINNNLEKAKHFYEVVKQLVAQKKNKHEKYLYAIVTGNLGLLYRNQGDTNKAFKYQNDALTIFRELNDTTGEAVTLDNIGSIHFFSGNYSLSLQLYREALKLHKKTKNFPQVAFEYDNIGNLYYTQGKLDSAMQYFRDALVLNRIIPDTIGVGYDFKSISSIFSTNNILDSTFLYLDSALYFYKKIGYKQGVAEVTCELGGLYLKKDSLDIALSYLNQALNLSQNKYIKVEADCLRFLGGIYKKKGEFNKAIEAHKKALELYKRIPNPLGVAYELGNIGNTYFEMKNYKEALNYLSRAKFMLEELELIIDVVKTQFTINKIELLIYNQEKNQ